ncbi:MAG: hypothetical protein IKT52_08830 [Oscillospiraceae bacterium]|nr:hypothetical protein [Oscillospiraceae bacterium]
MKKQGGEGVFGFVTASTGELDKSQKDRYGGIYCGICRGIKARATQSARLGLSYDMAFLALLLMSLYEPEEKQGVLHCAAHPLRRRAWIDNTFVRYAADMNVALSYYKLQDDWRDDRKITAKLLASTFEKVLPDLEAQYPRQCKAISVCLKELHALEQQSCPNPDAPAACFGKLMAELLVYQEDLWADTLRQVGFHLGRFIYMADAAVDYRADKRKGKYNPFLAMGTGEDWARWEEYLVLAMGRCTANYEKLPLVQDKALLDNILYSGVWCSFRGKGAKAREET